ncbi:hypothetical protein D3C76_37010 [compost metagenome]
MLIKKPVFKSVNDAVRAISLMALSPYGKNAGDSLPETVVEQTFRIEEYRILEDRVDSSIVAMWGDADFFYVYRNEKGQVIIVDGVHNDDPSVQKIDDDILHLLQRCMLANYVPRALLQAINEYGRGGPQGDFVNIFGDCIDHVEDILEVMGV